MSGKDGDYKWSSGSAPTNAGSYTITLTPDGISNLEKYILGLAGSIRCSDRLTADINNLEIARI